MFFQDHSTGAIDQPLRFVTLTKSDPDFSAHMNGRGPDGLRAVPVESFAVNSLRERVTFALFDSPGGTLKGLLAVARPELLPLSLGPVIVGVAAVQTFVPSVDVLKVCCLILSMIGLHISAFALNDVADHRRGIDRLQRQRGSQAIQRGFVSAAEVSLFGWSALAVATVAAIPLLLELRFEVLSLGLIGLLAVACFSRTRGFKSLGLGDWVVAGCMGPLVTLGVGEVLAPGNYFWMLTVGAPLGLAAAIVFQLRQFESILAERQVKSGTMVSRLGFDRTQKLLICELATLPVLTVVVFWSRVAIGPLLVSGVLIALGQWRLSRRVQTAVSPLASQLVGLGRLATWFHFGLSFLLILLVGSAA